MSANTLPLFDLGHGPKARRRDPITSQNAAARATNAAISHRDHILYVLGEGPGFTAAELAENTGLTVVQVCRRLPELQKRGLAKPGEARDGYRVWRAT